MLVKPKNGGTGTLWHVTINNNGVQENAKWQEI